MRSLLQKRPLLAVRLGGKRHDAGDNSVLIATVEFV